MSALGLNHVRASGAFFVAAAAWPSLLCLLAEVTMSPIERALRTSWCGSAPQAFALAGHCAACWTGALVLALAGAMVLVNGRRQIAAVRAQQSD